MALSNWDKKAQATFAKIMEVVPEPMQEAMKPQLISMVENKAAGSPVTTDVIERLVREDLPEPQKSVIMGALGLSGDAPQPQADEETPQLTWEGDSEGMVDKIMDVIPEMLRGAVKPKLLDFISKKAGASGTVTEILVSEAIQQMNPPEPYMSQIMKVLAAGSGIDLSKLDDILAQYQGKQEELVNIFHDVQQEYGHLPKAAIGKICEYLTIPTGTAYRIATSYQAFSLEPKKKHVVKVCNGTACHLNESDKLHKELERTSPGRFTLEKVRCIGCCGNESMVMVDEECGDSTWAQDKISKF
jgi:NADH-quinone oxidoreductase subunit E